MPIFLQYIPTESGKAFFISSTTQIARTREITQANTAFKNTTSPHLKLSQDWPA